MRVRRLTVVALAAIMTAGMACGDDSSPEAVTVGTEASTTTVPGSTTLPAPALTRDEYIRRADTICRRYNDGVDQMMNEAETAAASTEQFDETAVTIDPAVHQKFFQQFTTLGNGLMTEIRALPLPEGDAGRTFSEAFVEADRALADLSSKLSTPQGATDFFVGQLLSAFDPHTPPADPYAALYKTFADLGFQDCFVDKDEN